jgi:RNase P/RNase MRP subunit POP5
VAGDLSVPPRWVERELHRLLVGEESPGGPPLFRLVRWEGARGLVEVEHRLASRAREAWNATVTAPDGSVVTVATRRTWGTLRKGKVWLRGHPSDRPSHPGLRGV